ncbi:MAG: hypothetical protein R3A10_11675 [Caldilineaceae bacterium]
MRRQSRVGALAAPVKRPGMAIALVTHDVELAAQLADCVVLMSQRAR